MPSLTHLFIAKLLIFFCYAFQITDCQASVNKLGLADSLFTQKQYKEALDIYEELLLEDEAYSAAMLLKMAFISEGMGDYSKSTLYLSKYYDLNPNPKVIAKIKSLTNQANLVGYDVSDQEKFLKILVDVKSEVTGTFTFLTLLMLIFAWVFTEKRSLFYAPAFIFLLLGFVSNNFLNESETAIVTGSPTLIMESPSAAGNFLRKVDAGHRVKILSSKDIWYEVTWNDKKAYIRKDNLSKI